VPYDLSHHARPKKNAALSPDSGATITRAGKILVLCAVHDVVYPENPIVATPDIHEDFDEAMRLNAYHFLKSGVKDWPEDRWDHVDAYLADIEADAAAMYEYQGCNETTQPEALEVQPSVDTSDIGEGARLPRGVQGEHVFRKYGENWVVRFGDEEGSFPHLDGMVYIAHLLKNPGRRYSALEMKRLTATSEPNTERMLSGNSDEILDGTVRVTCATEQRVMDRETINACEKRLRDITQELDAAREAGDLEKIDELEVEEREIRQHLKRSENFRGEARPFSDPGRSNCVSVKQAIERVLKKFQKVDPPLRQLHEHLTRAIKTTDHEFEYVPSLTPLNWEF
jgi:hypothetical protein